MFVAFSEYKNFLLKPALASELVKTILFNQRVVWKTFDSISFCALVLVNYPNFSIIFLTAMWIVRTKYIVWHYSITDGLTKYLVSWIE